MIERSGFDAALIMCASVTSHIKRNGEGAYEGKLMMILVSEYDFLLMIQNGGITDMCLSGSRDTHIQIIKHGIGNLTDSDYQTRHLCISYEHQHLASSLNLFLSK